MGNPPTTVRAGRDADHADSRGGAVERVRSHHADQAVVRRKQDLRGRLGRRARRGHPGDARVLAPGRARAARPAQGAGRAALAERDGHRPH